jgi:hypothetical protein
MSVSGATVFQLQQPDALRGIADAVAEHSQSLGVDVAADDVVIVGVTEVTNTTTTHSRVLQLVRGSPRVDPLRVASVAVQ